MFLNSSNLSEIFYFVGYILFWFFIPILISYFIFIIIGWFKMMLRVRELEHEDFTPIIKSISMPEISFIVPMYNESMNIIPTIENLNNIIYRHKEIIIVNDGSSDKTMEIVHKYLELEEIPKLFEEQLPSAKIKKIYKSKKYREFTVLDKEHAGKYDALNAGINACSHDFFVGIDADTLIESESFEGMIRPMFSEEHHIAIGTTIRLLNGSSVGFQKIGTVTFPQCYLTGMQSLEYLRSFIQRQSIKTFGGFFVMAGAFTILRKKNVLEVGGYKNTVGEDAEIIMSLERKLHKEKRADTMIQLPDPVAWTTAPADWKTLGNQRCRWQRGICESLWLHKKIIFNPKYGWYGTFVIPFCVIWSEVLEPFAEFIAYFYIILGFSLGILNLELFLVFLLIAYSINFVHTVFAILIEESTFRRFSNFRTLMFLLYYSLIENFGYRQMTIFWRMWGTFQFIGNRFRKETIQNP